MNNIYQDIAVMRKGMRGIGCTKEEIENATNSVTNCDSYEDAILEIEKHWS